MSCERPSNDQAGESVSTFLPVEFVLELLNLLFQPLPFLVVPPLRVRQLHLEHVAFDLLRGKAILSGVVRSLGSVKKAWAGERSVSQIREHPLAK